MPTPNDPPARLTRLTELCLAFPEATCEHQAGHATFRVRKKVFAYYLNNHHGVGLISLCCKVLPGEHEALIAANPNRFYLPAYIGPRGWVALRLDRPTLNWSEVSDLLRVSYIQAAPKRLAQALT